MRLSAEQARARFADSPVAVLGTVDATGAAHLVPVTYVVSGDLVFIAIDDKPKRDQDLKRLRNIAAEPRVSLLAQHYQEDWSGLWWARADGTARVIDPADMPFAVLGGLMGRYAWYRTHQPNGPVIEVTVQKWSGWAFAESPPALGAAAEERER
jgi:PPOX class probable F420-dependent enzyme